MPNIKVIEYEESEGKLREIYDSLIKSRGKLADVHKIQSLLPETISSHINMYMDIMFQQKSISRELKEMIAVVVSKANNCEYCIQHHAEALNFFWKDQDRINKFIESRENIINDEKTLLLLQFAENLTLTPKNDSKIINNMKKSGWKDDEILHATLVVSYFNFVNRIVLSMGLEINTDEIKGYNYK